MLILNRWLLLRVFQSLHFVSILEIFKSLAHKLIGYIHEQNLFWSIFRHVALSDMLEDAGNVLSQSFPRCLNFEISILRRS